MKSAVAEIATRRRTVESARASGAQLKLAPYWFINPLSWIALLALKTYQLCVPTRYKPDCRFTPSCSRYMALAIRKYGFLAGTKLGWYRFHHCIGFVPGGEDWPQPADQHITSQLASESFEKVLTEIVPRGTFPKWESRATISESKKAGPINLGPAFSMVLPIRRAKI